MGSAVSHLLVKCIATFLLFSATVLFGLLPLKFASKITISNTSLSESALLRAQVSARRRKTFLGLCNCFAGGVFFSTCLLDLLPMVRNRMEEAIKEVGLESQFPLGEFIASFGFLMMLITEQIVHSCGKDSFLMHNVQHQDGEAFGATGEVTAPLLTNLEEQRCCSSYGSPNRVDSVSPGVNTGHCCDHPYIAPSPVPSEGDFDEDFVPRGRRRSKSLVSVQTITQSSFRTYILILALSLHSLFEGLAVGLVTSMDTLVQLLIALSIHKCILAFSLGVKLIDGKLRNSSVIKGMILFAAMAPVGMGLGLAVLSSFSRTIGLFFSGVLQGIATGTFLYVTFFEVLPQELDLHGQSKDLLLKVLFVVFGFAVIAGICYFENKFHHIRKILPHKS